MPHTSIVLIFFRFILAHPTSSRLPTLVEIGPAVDEKRAFKIEQTDAWTYTQYDFMVYIPFYVSNHPDFRDLGAELAQLVSVLGL